MSEQAVDAKKIEHDDEFQISWNRGKDTYTSLNDYTFKKPGTKKMHDWAGKKKCHFYKKGVNW
jgi:hypothetical protein